MRSNLEQGSRADRATRLRAAIIGACLTAVCTSCTTMAQERWLFTSRPGAVQSAYQHGPDHAFGREGGVMAVPVRIEPALVGIGLVMATTLAAMDRTSAAAVEKAGWGIAEVVAGSVVCTRDLATLSRAGLRARPRPTPLPRSAEICLAFWPYGDASGTLLPQRQSPPFFLSRSSTDFSPSD